MNFYRKNGFVVDEICNRDIDTLSDVQRKAVLCFWYDAEMNSGGHSGYFDCYPDISTDELAEALRIVGNEEIAQNFKKSLSESEEKNDWIETDNAYYEFEPSLCSYLEEYVKKNELQIFA